MAVVVFMRVSPQSGPKGYQNNDVVSIMNDGQTVGNQVDPVLNINSIFQIVDVPGESKQSVAYSLEPSFGAEIGSPGFETSPLLAKRLYSMQVNMLPGAGSLQTRWNQGQRISVTLAEFTAAVIPKAGP